MFTLSTSSLLDADPETAVFNDKEEEDVEMMKATTEQGPSQLPEQGQENPTTPRTDWEGQNFGLAGCNWPRNWDHFFAH